MISAMRADLSDPTSIVVDTIPQDAGTLPTSRRTSISISRGHEYERDAARAPNDLRARHVRTGSFAMIWWLPAFRAEMRERQYT
jgi:hypothetical protein